ncbi:hypothetical protein HGRIS_013119 [Hohenbuehelia grisea]|uniref:F-box domain-containing protein n=1 Tax=Hohenbuehelia grisea TaxID=104357 RepID=A0ABR3IUH3_9AGAR
MALDELCVLSATRPYNGGPSLLYWVDEDNTLTPEFAAIILKNLLSSPYLMPSGKFSKEDLEKIVSDVLEIHARLMVHNWQDEEYPWKLFPTKGWEGFEQFHVIGYFDEEEEQTSGNYWRPRPGCEVTTRIVDMETITPWCNFLQYWDEEEETWEEGQSNISACVGNPNIGCYEAPLAYLKAWIHWDALPPRSTAFPDEEEPLEVEAELYEIINTHREIPNDSSVLDFVDYGGIEKAYDQFQHTFDGAWSQTTVHFERAIRDGLRGEELMVPLSRDFGAWMCVRTDVWPEASLNDQPLILPATNSATTPFHVLPPELLFSILVLLSPTDYASLLIISRSLRKLLQGGAIDTAVRHQILSNTGPLRWLLPVDTMTGEEDAFKSACTKWLEASVIPSSSGNGSGALSVIQHSDFPHFAFLCAAWMQDSMRNRRRFWNITKQYEDLWVDYRTNGWHNDTFTKPPPADSHESELGEGGSPSEELSVVYTF